MTDRTDRPVVPTEAQPAPTPKAESVRIEAVTKAMLRAQQPLPWSDPSNLAVFSAEKRQAILDNPLLTDEQAPVQLLGVRGGVVIGRLDLVHGVISAGGQETAIAWGSEWYVPPEHRASLVGVSLILKQAQLYPNIGASGPSQLAVPVYQKLKWGDIPLTRWILLRRSRSVVERYMGKGALAQLATFVLDLALWKHGFLLHFAWWGTDRRWKRERIDRFPADLDPQLRRSMQSHPVACHRSAAWLNWLLTHSFKTDPRSANLVHLIRDRAGTCVGYTVSKVRFFPVATHRGFKDLLLGAVQEYTAFDPSITDADLIRLAVLELDSHGVDAIEVSLEDKAIGRALMLKGFLRVGAMHMMFRASPKSPLSNPDFGRPGSWRTRPIDGDNFFV